jgi:parallel beta-helix repeat protein
VGAYRGITITDNTVTGCAMPGILMTSTADLRIGRNTLGQWTGARHIPEEMRRAGLAELKPVVKTNCSK